MRNVEVRYYLTPVHIFLLYLECTVSFKQQRRKCFLGFFVCVFFYTHFPGLGFSPSSAVSLLGCRVILLFISMAKPVSTLLWMAKRTGFFFFPSSLSETHKERGKWAETHCPLFVPRSWECICVLLHHDMKVWKNDRDGMIPKFVGHNEYFLFSPFFSHAEAPTCPD